MTELEIHGDRTATAAASQDNGVLGADISREMVGLYKRYAGMGPVRCRTYMQRELVTVVLGGGFTASEKTLFEDGKWHEVRRARQIWQDTMEERFVALIEAQTGREVLAFMSAMHQDPDLAVELFVMGGEVAPATPE